MASENGSPAEQKCCKCLQIPSKPIDCDSDHPVYFMVNLNGSFGHLGIDPSGEMVYNFKCVNMYYVPKEGELLYCDDCAQDELDQLNETEDIDL